MQNLDKTEPLFNLYTVIPNGNHNWMEIVIYWKFVASLVTCSNRSKRAKSHQSAEFPTFPQQFRQAMFQQCSKLSSVSGVFSWLGKVCVQQPLGNQCNLWSAILNLTMDVYLNKTKKLHIVHFQYEAKVLVNCTRTSVLHWISSLSHRMILSRNFGHFLTQRTC